MFWNDPNLYSVAFKDTPNLPMPFYGQIPRYYTPFTPYDVKQNFFTPPVTPSYFTPPVTPSYFTPPVTPTWLTPQINPFFQTPIHRFMDPMTPQVPFNWTLPYFQGYRPFGL